MIIASNAFLELQHSFSTSLGMATGTLMLVRNRSRRSALAIRISVDASKTTIMTKYDERNHSKKEMDFRRTKGIPHREKIAAKAHRSNVQQLALALFSCGHLYQFARRIIARLRFGRRCHRCLAGAKSNSPLRAAEGRQASTDSERNRWSAEIDSENCCRQRLPAPFQQPR